MSFKTIYDQLIEKVISLVQDVLLIRQLFKFSFVGVLNTAVGYFAYLLFLNFFDYTLALVISHFVGVTHSYVWNKYWTFKTEKIRLKEFVKFNSVYFIVLVVNFIALVFLVDILEFDERIGQLIMVPIIAIISFTGHKYWSFTGK